MLLLPASMPLPVLPDATTPVTMQSLPVCRPMPLLPVKKISLTVLPSPTFTAPVIVTAGWLFLRLPTSVTLLDALTPEVVTLATAKLTVSPPPSTSFWARAERSVVLPVGLPIASWTWPVLSMCGFGPMSSSPESVTLNDAGGEAVLQADQSEQSADATHNEPRGFDNCVLPSRYGRNR